MLAIVTFAVPAPERRVFTRRRCGTRPRCGFAIGLAIGLALALMLASPESRAAPVEGDDDAAAADAAVPEPESAVEEPSELEPVSEPEPEPAPEPEDTTDEVAEPEPEPEPAPEPEAPIRPPRFDGPYVGVLAMGTVNFPKVLKLATPSPLIGAGGFVQAGDAVFWWMSIGIAAGGQAAWAGNQQMFEGALLVEFAFAPIRHYPLSLRTGFGFGGGAVKEQGVEGRSGYGGALFKGTFRYEFFPLADKKRPDRGGGWAIGPELGWLGATPAGKNQPFVNTILFGLSTSFYFGS